VDFRDVVQSEPLLFALLLTYIASNKQRRMQARSKLLCRLAFMFDLFISLSGVQNSVFVP
jgi:hypothetical protein